MAVNPDSNDPDFEPETSGQKNPQKPSANRREFLSGRSALDALRGNAERAEDSLAESVFGDRSFGGGLLNRQSGYLEQYSKNAMACEFELLFNLHQYPQSGGAAMKAFQLIDLLEDQMTVYRDHSEVSRVNQDAFDREIVLDRRLFRLLKLAKLIYTETGHAFDVTASPLTRVWGFDQRKGSVPLQDQIDEALGLVGSEFIELNNEANSIRFRRNGIRIDLGGIGKGHALDRVGALMAKKSIGDFVIHGGQSSVLAKGSSECKPSQRKSHSSASESDHLLSSPESPGWSVGISHPTLPGVRLAEVRLRDRALGTSGTGRQGFFYQGKRYGHIIDPRTGWPASHFLSTTVITKSAAVSDALATAFFVMSFEEVESYCVAHPDVSAILITNDSTQKSQVKLEVLNLPDTDWQQLA